MMKSYTTLLLVNHLIISYRIKTQESTQTRMHENEKKSPSIKYLICYFLHCLFA